MNIWILNGLLGIVKLTESAMKFPECWEISIRWDIFDNVSFLSFFFFVIIHTFLNNVYISFDPQQTFSPSLGRKNQIFKSNCIYCYVKNNHNNNNKIISKSFSWEILIDLFQIFLFEQIVKRSYLDHDVLYATTFVQWLSSGSSYSIRRRPCCGKKIYILTIFF